MKEQFEVTGPFPGGWGFITILDVFIHHFTKEPMFYIRIEAVDEGCAYVEYKVLDQSQFNELLMNEVDEEAKDEQ